MEEPPLRLRPSAPAAPPSKWLPDVVVIGGFAPRSEASAIKTEIQNVVARMSLRFRNQVRFVFTTALRDNKGFIKMQDSIDVWAFVEQLRAAYENFNKPVAAGGWWASRGNTSAALGLQGQLRTAKEVLTEMAGSLQGHPGVELDPYRKRIMVVGAGEVVAKHMPQEDMVDYNWALLQRWGVARATVESRLAALREERRFL
jgi:hypothetical protein